MPSKSSGKSKKPSADAKQPKRQRSAGSVSPEPKSSPSDPPGPVMGLDLSLTGCGITVLRGTEVLHLARLSTFPIPPSQGLKPRAQGQRSPDRFIGNDEQRIAWLAKKIVKTIRKNKVCFVLVEDHAFSAKGRGKTVLGELHGVVKHYLMKEDVAFVLKTPQTIKKHVTGNGRAEKMDMIMAAKAAGVDLSDSDRADAWGCARLAWDTYSDLTE